MTKSHSSELKGGLPSAADAGTLLNRKELATVAFERTRMPMVVTDARRTDHPIVLANSAFLHLTGYRGDEVLGRNCRFLQGEGTSKTAIAEIRSGLQAERNVSVELLNYRKDGSAFWNMLHLSPIHDELGNLLYHYGSQIDQTRYRQVQALEASEHRLLMEVDHRTKNVLALVDTIVRLSRSDNAHHYSGSVQQRIQSLARSHAMLADRNWTGVSLRQLVQKQLETMPLHQLTVDGPSIELDPLVVQPLGLVINELAMNAAQHGSLSLPSGHVTINWVQALNTGLSINWVETGGPPVQKPVGTGFGLAIASGTVRHQLFGAIAMDWKPSGLVATLYLPRPQAFH